MIAAEETSLWKDLDWSANSTKGTGLGRSVIQGLCMSGFHEWGRLCIYMRRLLTWGNYFAAYRNQKLRFETYVIAMVSFSDCSEMTSNHELTDTGLATMLNLPSDIGKITPWWLHTTCRSEKIGLVESRAARRAIEMTHNLTYELIKKLSIVESHWSRGRFFGIRVTATFSFVSN